MPLSQIQLNQIQEARYEDKKYYAKAFAMEKKRVGMMQEDRPGEYLQLDQEALAEVAEHRTAPGRRLRALRNGNPRRVQGAPPWPEGLVKLLRTFSVFSSRSGTHPSPAVFQRLSRGIVWL